MRKEPSMIQHSNRPCESPHLSNGDTMLAMLDRHATETFFCDLPARFLLLRIFVAALSHSGIGPI
jgi:hypothetical protein